MATGKALDMMEAAPIRAYKTRISGVDTIEEVLRNDVVMIAAGKVREPGMKREDLFGANRELVEELAQKLRGSKSKVIVATEPVDLLTSLLVKRSGLPREQVLGLGGILDSGRLRYLIARELEVSFENVGALVVGRHSPSMVPLVQYCNVSGAPLTSLLSDDRIQALFDETRKAGDLIVEMAQRASSYYGPSAAACDLAESIVRNLRRVLPVSIVLDGELGVKGVALSVPAIIAANGVERVLPPALTTQESSEIEKSAKELADALKKGAAA